MRVLKVSPLAILNCERQPSVNHLILETDGEERITSAFIMSSSALRGLIEDRVVSESGRFQPETSVQESIDSAWSVR